MRWRRERPPAVALGPLESGERVVSWADVDESGQRVVLATPRGLWWPEEPARLIGWEFVDKAVWCDGVLTVVQADVVDGDFLVDRPPVALPLRTPRDLPPIVRKRVEANIVRRELLTVGGGAVRFVGRRRPGIDGVVWWARLEPGTRDTEDVRAAVRARLALLRAAP